ncbi:Transposable element Tcb1 transposase, partial [Stegodyphus mimosarum]
MQKRSDLSDFQKGMIIGFRAKGGSISETAEFVNCSRAAVVKVYRAWQNGTVQNQRRGKCGAPRAIDDRGERRLRRCVRADRRATVEQLTTKMNQGATKSVSQSTIQRTLLRLGLRSRRLVRAPMLTAVHRRRRLEFARQYSSWTSTEWRQVAFSDESRFMLHRTDGRWRIRRETSERNHPATIAGTVQAGGGSIMVWGMFSWHSLGSLIIVEGTMDQYKYASVLADHVHPYMRIVFPQDDGIFQQDNARCHTAASVRAWFEEHQDEFTVLPWPANSPDLNPIEHLGRKKLIIQKRFLAWMMCSDEPTLAYQITDDEIIGSVLNSPQQENDSDTDTDNKFDRSEKISFNEGLEHDEKYLKYLDQQSCVTDQEIMTL